MKNVLLVVVATITIVAPAVAAGELKTCQGVLTENWTTQGVAIPHPENGTRLIRADNIIQQLFICYPLQGRQTNPEGVQDGICVSGKGNPN